MTNIFGSINIFIERRPTMRLKHLTVLVLSSICLLTACGNNSELYTTPADSNESTDLTDDSKETSSKKESAEESASSELSSDDLEPSKEVIESKDSTSKESSEAPTAATAATTDDGQTLPVQAQSAVLYNCTDGKLIASKNEHNLVYPGSTAKLMTALLAIEHIPLDTVITVGDELDLVEAGSSLAYIQKGHRLTMQTLLEGSLIPSGNDTSYTIAAAVGRVLANDNTLTAKDAVDVFVKAMNDRAKELGMKHSTFTTPDGFDDSKQLVTASDMAILSAEFMKHSELLDITRLHRIDATFASGQTITWTNTNHLLDPENEYYIPDCIGLKTGSSEYSGYCIISGYEHNGKQYAIIVMNGASNGRWNDSNILYDYMKTLP